MSFSDRDNGYDKLMRTFALGLPSVTVGIHAEEGGAAKQDGEGLTVADVATIHEFGLGVPERSIVRGFVDENRSEIERILKVSARQVVKGSDPNTQAERVGAWAVGKMKERVIAGIEPPLTEETKRQKMKKSGGGPKETPLILTSQLLSSIVSKVEK